MAVKQKQVVCQQTGAYMLEGRAGGRTAVGPPAVMFLYSGRGCIPGSQYRAKELNCICGGHITGLEKGTEVIQGKSGQILKPVLENSIGHRRISPRE